MHNIDEAKKRFDIFKSKITEFITNDLTESDTRSKLLDDMFKNVLGWLEADIEREKFVQIGYYDYLLSIPGFQFVIEAKKNFIEFQLPVKHKSLTLSVFEKSNKEVVKQIRQ